MKQFKTYKVAYRSIKRTGAPKVELYTARNVEEVKKFFNDLPEVLEILTIKLA